MGAWEKLGPLLLGRRRRSTGPGEEEEEHWEERLRTCIAVSVGQVFPAVFAIPSHAACLKDKISSCPLRSFEVKGTTKYHDYQIKAMGKALGCFQSTHVPLPACRGLWRLP